MDFSALCQLFQLNEKKLPLVRGRVEKMLKRKREEHDPGFTRNLSHKIICLECNTLDWDEDVVTDVVLGTLICKRCGLELNHNLLQERLEVDTLQGEEPYSMQHFFESHLNGGSKLLRKLNAQVEKDLRAEDGKTSEKYKNTQRTELYHTLEEWAEHVGIDENVRLQARTLWNQLRENTARLHSPMLAMIVCLVLAEEQLRKEGEVLQHPLPIKPKPTPSMTYGKTRRDCWIQTLSQQER